MVDIRVKLLKREWVIEGDIAGFSVYHGELYVIFGFAIVCCILLCLPIKLIFKVKNCISLDADYNGEIRMI